MKVKIKLREPILLDLDVRDDAPDSDIQEAIYDSLSNGLELDLADHDWERDE